jgi:LPS O-antigen subunit length determinant protein (WzzB/FepE family)
MDQIKEYEEVNLMEYFLILWKRRWLIIIPTAILILAAGIAGFLSAPVWEVDALILPSKFLAQTQQGQFTEVLAVEPKQVASQINQDSYISLLAGELGMNIRTFPKIRAENLRDTKLIRISVRVRDVDQGRRILALLFDKLKADFDRKIEVEIANNQSEIKAQESQKDITKQEILAEENKLKISEDRARGIARELKSVKTQVDQIDAELKDAIKEKRPGIDAVALLLYSNEVQNNLRYYDMLEERLSAERITREDLRLSVRRKTEALKQLDANIELLEEKKQRIEYARLVKPPTPSNAPVSPRKARNILLAGVLGIVLFGFLALFLESVEKTKNRLIRKP